MNRSRSPLRRRLLSRAIVASATLLVVSCGGEPRLALPASPSPTSASAVAVAPLVVSTPAAVKPSIGEVVWTTGADSPAGDPAEAVTRYLTDAPRLVAVTKAAALPAGSSVEAAWTYNDTPLEPLTTRLSADNVTEGRWLSFHLTRDPNTPWPAGMYEIKITLDGTLMQESSVEVVDTE